MKIVGKIIKWTILACIAAFLLVWWGALLKNYILTIQHRDVMENMVMCDCDLTDALGGVKGDIVYEHVLSYTEKRIKTYYVQDCGEDYYIGGYASYTLHSDGTWDMRKDVSWSSGGTADNYVWPYWHHFFKYQ
jgi:hypothetical protein